LYVIHLLQGDTKEQILALTENIKPGMLVIGSRGLGALRRTFLGSVSDYCVHNCPCPVVVVKKPGEHAGVEGHKV